MICLRCGYCCKEFDVIIVDDPNKGILERNLIHKPAGEQCRHLRLRKNGLYRCTVHNKRWYKYTPCFAHGQIETKNSKCRMGKYILNKKG